MERFKGKLGVISGGASGMGAETEITPSFPLNLSIFPSFF
jgi:hypothetical protein